MSISNITSTRPPLIASVAKGVNALHHPNEATEKISNSFERFNPYAQEALKLDDDAEVYAALAIAFEVGQLRYQLSAKPVDNTDGKVQGSHHVRSKHGRPAR